MIIAKKLIELRGSRTQAQIARAIGVSVSTYGMYEIGKRMPSDEIKIKIAKLHRKSVQSIFFSKEATKSVQLNTKREDI